MMRWRWAIAMVLATAVVIAGVNVAYTNHVQREADQRQQQVRHESDQRWCSLLTTLDQPSPEPSTERGRELQRQVHQLRSDLGCVPGGHG